VEDAAGLLRTQQHEQQVTLNGVASRYFRKPVQLRQIRE
jgi:hypothetical protein